MNGVFRKLTLLAVLVALFVVVLGAYVRLSDAGLGCPDWPGCYGNLVIQEHPEAVEQANQAYPQRPFEAHKAWKEMIHRYAASGLGLLILALTIMAWRKSELQLRGLTTSLLGLVIFQGLLGMWTVTLLVMPVIVMSHLLGGLATLSLLFWLYLRVSDQRGMHKVFPPRGLVWLARLGLILLILQIALGGWTSTNYAAFACPAFPTCYADGNWWPDLNYRSAFVIWHGIGIDYEGGILSTDARAAIHWLHRVGAALVVLVLTLLSASMLRHRHVFSAALVMIFLCIQVGIGIANVWYQLPLQLAVAHNGGAALLLLAVLLANFQLTSKQRRNDYQLGK